MKPLNFEDQVKAYEKVDRVTTKVERAVKKEVKKRHPRFTLRHKLIAIGIGLGFVFALMFVSFIRISAWYDKHQVKFQSPIRFYAPFIIEKRKAEIEYKEVIITPTPTLPPFKREGDQIVPVKPQSIVPIKKFLTDDGAKNRERVLAMAAVKYSGDELVALDNILKKEAGYNPSTINEIGCGGIGQACPASKMGCPLSQEGLECQANWAIKYIENRYGDPIKAYQFHLVNNWY